MRHATLFAITMGLLAGCVADAGEDGIDDQGFGGGKADGDELTTCEQDAIIAYLNEGPTVAALKEAGVKSRAAKELVKHRDGADGVFGTDDDNKFDDVAEVDAVPYVGPAAVGALHAASADRCAVDAYADARDVTKALVVFPANTPAPTAYEAPEGGAFYLSGTEFWQKWSGGKNPTYSFSEGTDAGRRCMQASAIRFGAIMKNPPPELVKLDADTNWGGSFYNWNDDFSGPNAYGDGTGARLWAWRTSLIKFISQTKKDGSCLLPTLDMVVRQAKACLETGAAGNGEIQGCQVR